MDGLSNQRALLESAESQKRVLVICTGNSCRSQIAEGLINHYWSPAWSAASAGSAPTESVHPLAVEAMRELGIFLDDHTPKSISMFEGDTFDLVITVCSRAKEVCPYFPGKRIIHMPFEDPASSPHLQAFRDVREQILASLRDVLGTPAAQSQ